MAFFRKDTRSNESAAAGARTLEEPMESTLADNGGMARITFSMTGMREAAGRWLTGTVEFAGFGLQVFLEDALLKFEDVRAMGQSIWKIADSQEGEASFEFQPHLKLRVRAPSKKSARLEVFVEFTLGTDAHATANLQTDGTFALAFVEALERGLEAIEDI